MIAVPSHYKSFGMVALEAMACGTPVIASDVGGLSFIVRSGESGFPIPDQDMKVWADCMECLLHDPELRDELGQQGAAVAQQYAWSRIADRIVDLYRCVVAGPGEPARMSGTASSASSDPASHIT